MSNQQPTGILWYDNSTAPWPEKVLAAAQAYQKKFWIKATRCHVHPKTIQTGQETRPETVTLTEGPNFVQVVGEVEVYTQSTQPLNHFFVFNHLCPDPRKPEIGPAQKTPGKTRARPEAPRQPALF